MGKKNHVNKLKQYARRTQSDVKYEEVFSEEPGHVKKCFQRVVVNSQVFPPGEGRDMGRAKQNAAKNALRHLLANDPELNYAKNDDGEQGRVPLKPLDPNKLRLNNAASFDVGDETAASGKTKKKAAELSHQELCGSKTAEDVVISEEKNTGNRSTDRASIQSEIISFKRFLMEFDSIEVLGKGSFGIVFKANHKLSNTKYAVKRVRYTESARREVMALSKLRHINIVIYNTCWVEDSDEQMDDADDTCSSSLSNSNSSAKFLYIQMELCDTRTLRGWIEDQNKQNMKKRRENGLTIAKQIFSGVECIHSSGFIHRDLKPANIMFGRDGEVKIGDFGLVTADQDDGGENLLERTGYKGTPSYMAPEQKSEQTYDRKVDIFAIGLIFFEVLCRINTVHERGSIWENVRQQKFPPEFLSRFPGESIIIKLMLCVNPEDRPEASKLKADMERIIRQIEDVVRRVRTV